MQGHLDLYPGTVRRLVSVEPSGSTAWILIMAGSCALLGATYSNTTIGYLLFFSVAFGLLCVGTYILLLRARRLAPQRRAQLAFDAVYMDRREPCFATDTMGRVLIKNRQMENLLADDKSREASQCLALFGETGAAAAYRILNRLQFSSQVTEMLDGVEVGELRVSALTSDREIIYWSVETSNVQPIVEATDPMPHSCAVIVSGANREIISVNSKAKSVFEGDLVVNPVLASVLNDGQTSNGQIINVADKRYRLFQAELDDITIETILVPVPQEELIVADPEQFYNTLPVAIARISDDGSVIYANDAAVDLLGARARPGARIGDLMEGLGRSIEERVRDMCHGRSHMRSEVARAKVRGQEAFLQVTLKRLLLNGDTTLLAVINDATELKTLEQQFVQSQKMHAVGQLAGGVAHDFNNLLTAINGHCDLVLMRHQPMDTDYGDLIQIRHNANRAASLVGQLLAFSRKQTLVPKVVDLYETLSDINHLLNRLLGEKVSLRIEAGNDLPNVRVDERQLEQVIMNLVVNARDAMPDGGEVEIKAREITFKKDIKRDNAVVPFGQYVQIDVSDTGVGIPSDQIRKIFEPFYTTKKVGEGTGLGLSTAYGIIKQTGGFIFAQSEVGIGTTFTVYLPAMTEAAQDTVVKKVEETRNQDLTGSGVVLLVEDEVPVRSFAARALTIRGYTVLEAASAEEALEILEDHDLHVDIFVSDVIMPGMDGPTWVRKAQEVRPDAKVVFVSGYAEDAFEGGKIKVPNATFLPKPFSLNDLTLTVKEQMSATLH